MDRRRIIAGQNKTRLPREYKEVEWIASSGTQYIDTKILGTDNTRILLTYAINGNLSSPYTLLGYRNNNDTGDNFTLSLQGSSYNQVNFGIGTETIGLFKFSELSGMTDKNVIHNIDGNTSRLIIDGIQKTYGGTCIGNSKIALFCRFESNSTRTANMSQIKVYSFRILKNDTSEVQADFVPCYRKNDNVIGLYNLITNEFFVNKGTGTFTKGSDVK